MLLDYFMLVEVEVNLIVTAIQFCHTMARGPVRGTFVDGICQPRPQIINVLMTGNTSEKTWCVSSAGGYVIQYLALLAAYTLGNIAEQSNTYEDTIEHNKTSNQYGATIKLFIHSMNIIVCTQP